MSAGYPNRWPAPIRIGDMAPSLFGISSPESAAREFPRACRGKASHRGIPPDFPGDPRGRSAVSPPCTGRFCRGAEYMSRFICLAPLVLFGVMNGSGAAKPVAGESLQQKQAACPKGDLAACVRAREHLLRTGGNNGAVRVPDRQGATGCRHDCQRRAGHHVARWRAALGRGWHRQIHPQHAVR